MHALAEYVLISRHASLPTLSRCVYRNHRIRPLLSAREVSRFRFERGDRDGNSREILEQHSSDRHTEMETGAQTTSRFSSWT